MSLVLGLDGGGTKTVLALADRQGRADHRLAMAGLAPMVTGLAADNATASGIVDQAVAALALQAVTAWRLLGREDVPVWSWAGGVFRAGIVLDRLQGVLGVAPVKPRLPPVGGALLQAALAAGWVADDGWTERLAQSLAEHETADTRVYA